MRESRRVLYLTDGLGQGGLERQLTLLASSLPEPWLPAVWALRGGYYSQLLRDNSIRLSINERKWRYDIRPLFSLFRYSKSFRPDILHSWGWMSGLAGAFLSRLYGVPLIEGSIQRGLRPPDRRYRTYTVPRLGKIALANSRAGLRAWNISSSKGRVLHNGFDVTRLMHLADYGGIGDRIGIVMAASMTQNKDYDSFIQAAQELVNKSSLRSELMFLCLGNGPEYKRLQRMASELLESRQMLMPGAVDEVFKYYSASDIGVLMSTTGEGISNSIIEYMAAGLAVVCSDNEGNRELTDDGKYGILIPSFDSNALCYSIEHLARDSQYRLELGRSARAWVLERFSLRRMIKKAAGIYESVLDP